MPRAGQKSEYPRMPRAVMDTRPGHFSPGGRLLQVEYARGCPESGALSVAMRFQDGVLLAKGQTVASELGLRVPAIWRLSRTTAYVANGNLGDMFFLHDVLSDRRSRTPAAAARTIRNLLHEHAVRTDVRPLALLVLLGTVHGAAKIVGFDVTGSQWECDAWAIGDGSFRARDRLIRGWHPDLNGKSAEHLLRRIFGRMRYEHAVLAR